MPIYAIVTLWFLGLALAGLIFSAATNAFIDAATDGSIAKAGAAALAILVAGAIALADMSWTFRMLGIGD